MTSPDEPTGRVDVREPVDVLLRPADDADVDPIAAVLLAARSAAVAAGTMPPSVHPPTDLPRHVREHLLPRREVWVAEDAESGEVIAMISLDTAWLDDLYVHPDRARRGIGSALLQLAQAARPDGFDLWVFEANRPAQRFYERHGLVEVERTDGRENEERAPDRRYRWAGSCRGRATRAGSSVGGWWERAPDVGSDPFPDI